MSDDMLCDTYIKRISHLDVDSFQLFSSSLGVQILVVISGVGPDVPHNGERKNHVQSLVLGSSESVEHSVVGSTLERLGSPWRNGVDGDELLFWGTDVTPPSHISLWSSATHCV